MTPGEIASYGSIVSGLGVTGLLALAVVVLWRSGGGYVSKTHHGEVVKEKDAQLAAQARYIAQIEELYKEAIVYAQKRGDLLHQEKEALLQEVSGITQSLSGLTGALAELRETVRDLIRLRQV